jgi:signal transduction histidine kinase
MIASASFQHAVEDLKRLDVPEDIIDSLVDGENACKASLVVLNDMLTYETINAGKYKLYPELILLVPLLSGEMKRNKILGRDKNIKFVFESTIAEDLDKKLFAYIDVPKIEQVFRNLISNSIKFAGNNSTIRLRLQLEIKEFASSLSILNDDRFKKIGTISFSIIDEGVGISGENLARVFGQFNQFDPNILQGGGGTGLGLFISQKIIHCHGGSIDVFSEGVGKGTTFTVRLDAFKLISNLNEESSIVHNTKEEG